jgi:hypothetical protein
MFRIRVVRRHVFPGIDFQHMPFRGLLVRTVGLSPNQPPMVYGALLLTADIAVERFGPGQFTPHAGLLIVLAEQ